MRPPRVRSPRSTETTAHTADTEQIRTATLLFDGDECAETSLLNTHRENHTTQLMNSSRDQESTKIAPQNTATTQPNPGLKGSNSEATEPEHPHQAHDKDVTTTNTLQNPATQKPSPDLNGDNSKPTEPETSSKPNAETRPTSWTEMSKREKKHWRQKHHKR